jgi:phosphopantothenoylcysteine synthetase/decarboxylase
MLTAIETTGTINANHKLVLDEDLPNNAPSRVRVIVLFDGDTTDFGEKEWMKAASKNEAFDFLNDEAEDIYNLEDGKPVDNEI